MESIRTIIPNISNKTRPTGRVKNMYQGRAPQKQLPSWQGCPVDSSAKLPPINPTIKGENPKKIMTNSHNGSLVR